MALRMSLRFLYGCIFTYAFPSDVVVQDHRGTIVEGLGCIPVINNLALGYPLVFIWPSILSLIAAVYAFLSFRTFLSLRRRNTINEPFSSGYSISNDQYLRLMCFSLVPKLLMFPLTFTLLLLDIKLGPQPWVSWEDTHSNFNRFESYPAAVIEANPYAYAPWVVHLCACLVSCFVFFIFLGTNDGQRRQYRRWFFVILRPFGIKPAPSSTDSPTVWQRPFGRTATATTTITLTPTPFTFSGAPDAQGVGKEIFEHSDYQTAERGETGNPREERLKVKAILE